MDYHGRNSVYCTRVEDVGLSSLSPKGQSRPYDTCCDLNYSAALPDSSLFKLSYLGILSAPFIDARSGCKIQRCVFTIIVQTAHRAVQNVILKSSRHQPALPRLDI